MLLQRHTLNSLLEGQENYPSFAEAFHWRYANRETLESLESTQFNLEIELEGIESHNRQSLDDDALISLFADSIVGAGPAKKSRKKKQAAKSKHHSNRQHTNRAPVKSNILSISEPKKAPAAKLDNNKLANKSDHTETLLEALDQQGEWIKVTNKQPRHIATELKTVGTHNYYAMDVSFITHTGQQTTTLITDCQDSQQDIHLEALADGIWNPRTIHRQAHPSFDNMFYHYDKHCCQGVPLEERITIQQYCQLVRESYQETEARNKYHRDSLEEIRTTSSTNPIYAAYASLPGGEIRCHTLYLRDPNSPQIPKPFTLKWLLSKAPLTHLGTVGETV